MARKTHTSNEVKQRWESKAYKKILIRLRYDTDKELLDYIEQHKDEDGTTNIFREALQEYIKNNS